MVLAAALIGAAWRRWFGSARPSWAWPGSRATHIAAGFAVLALLLAACAADPLVRVCAPITDAHAYANCRLGALGANP